MTPSQKPSLHIIDQLGYMPLDLGAASPFFQVISKRYESGSVFITSNLHLAKWGTILSDEIVGTTTIDRLVHHSRIVALEEESYRTKTGNNTCPNRTKDTVM